MKKVRTDLKTAELVEITLATVLVALWGITLALQLTDFAEFKRKLFGQVFSHAFTSFLLYFIPSGILTAALLLCRQSTRWTGFALSLFLMSLFTGYTGMVVLGLFDQVPCSCISLFKGMSFQQQLYFNLIFTAVAAAGFISPSKHFLFKVSGRRVCSKETDHLNNSY
jgi:hypothetical protein